MTTCSPAFSTWAKQTLAKRTEIDMKQPDIEIFDDIERAKETQPVSLINQYIETV